MKGQKRRNLVRFMVLTNKQCRSSEEGVHARRTDESRAGKGEGYN